MIVGILGLVVCRLRFSLLMLLLGIVIVVILRVVGLLLLGLLQFSPVLLFIDIIAISRRSCHLLHQDVS
jgi:hypothetical protein